MKTPAQLDDLATRFLIHDEKKFRLKDHDPAETAGLKEEFKPIAQQLLKDGVERLSDLQDKLYAQDRWAVLLIFQAMDAAGKDSTIKHVMSGVNPQGCEVHSFKKPTDEELSHDYLWRTSVKLPERGHIGIFNRSYYEEVLVTRVHPEILALEQIPEKLLHDKNNWKHRYEDINNWEQHLVRNGTVICKFFLHVSKAEQRKRFLQRLEDPKKNWKFSLADMKERDHWDDYQNAYENMIAHTSTKHAPWFVVPADNKWFARLAVSAIVVDALKSLKLAYPEVSADKKKELHEALAQLKKNK